jgi:hypothetical protein
LPLGLGSAGVFVHTVLEKAGVPEKDQEAEGAELLRRRHAYRRS